MLFSDAYTLVDKDSKKEAYDVQFSYAPTSYKYQVAAYLKDSIFGGNKYLVNYDISESEIFMTIRHFSLYIIINRIYSAVLHFPITIMFAGHI